MKALILILTIISNSDRTFVRFRVNIRLKKSLLYFLKQTNKKELIIKYYKHLMLLLN